MVIRKITWQQTIPIRHSVLWPNEKPQFCFVEGDEEATHFGAFDKETLTCVASIYIDNNNARLRKFATLHGYQSKGIGTLLLQHIIKNLHDLNIRYFWCDARESAIGFYQRFGLITEGDVFYKSDVPYYKMSLLMSDI